MKTWPLFLSLSKKKACHWVVDFDTRSWLPPSLSTRSSVGSLGKEELILVGLNFPGQRFFQFYRKGLAAVVAMVKWDLVCLGTRRMWILVALVVSLTHHILSCCSYVIFY